MFDLEKVKPKEIIFSNDILSVIKFEDSNEKYLVLKDNLNVIIKGDFCITTVGELNIMSRDNFNVDADKINLNSDETKQIKFLKSLLKDGKLDIIPLLEKVNNLETKLKKLEDKSKYSWWDK